MNLLTRALRCLALVAGLAAWSSSVHAACTDPLGTAGDVRYAANYNTLAFCNGTDWVSTAGGSGGGGDATALSGLSDVNTSGATTGSILSYNGSSWVVSSTGGGTALGDRITSGTHTVAVNTSSGYVSLSTSGTDWGYLGSGNSYLPTITANKVSSTNVSATYLQLNSPTTVLACDSGLTGSMRYTSGTMQVCDGSNWGNIGIGVPTGTIAAFAASSCPSGWTEYTAARGRFLRGIDNGAGVDPAGTRSPGNAQTDAFQGHWHTMDVRTAAPGSYSSSGAAYGGPNAGNAAVSDSGKPQAAISDGVNGTPRLANETRPSNVAVTFCVYSGFQSAPATVITQLSSLTDVSVGGAQNGQVLTYSGGTWIASNTAGGGGSGVSAMASLTDVTLTNLAGRDHLRYDANISRWVNISESTVMSTTTMMNGWPDAIHCSYGNGEMFLPLAYKYVPSTEVYYSLQTGGSTFSIIFNASTQAYTSHANMAGSNCLTKSISQLYAEGKAFNFIGNANTGSGALGDRITSGTLAMVANSETSYVSLSTNGTTWGYLNSGISYLPTLTANRVSSTNISATTAEFAGEVVSSVSGPGGNFIASGSTSVSASGAGIIRFATAGSERMGIDATGTVTIKPGSQLIVEAPTSGISRRASFGFSNWQIGQDLAENGTKDFFVWDIDNTAVRLFVGITGNMGVGTYTPDQGKVEVKGGTVCVDTNSDDNATSCIANESDIRLKKDIVPLANSLETLMKLRGVTFNWRVSDSEVTRHYPLINRFAARPASVGVIAQEVEKVFPLAVELETVGDEEVQYKQVDYSKFTPLLIEAVKELKVANDNAIKAANDNDQSLREEIDQLRRELRELKQANKK